METEICPPRQRTKRRAILIRPETCLFAAWWRVGLQLDGARPYRRTARPITDLEPEAKEREKRQEPSGEKQI